MSYDSRCYDLAALFLSDNPEKNTEENRDELAQHIQTEIEGWIEFILKSPREVEARKECARRGLNPDDDAADGALVWMVVDQEMQQGGTK